MTNLQLSACFAALRQGEGHAFEDLYREMATPLYTVILRIVGDRGQAEDALQELFVRLFRSPPGEDIRNPRAYLFRMAHNLAIDQLRRREEHVSLEGLGAQLPAADEDRAAVMDVENAVAALPAAPREIVALHLNGGLTFREIAVILSLPLGTVLWRYRQAIGILRDSLKGGLL